MKVPSRARPDGSSGAIPSCPASSQGKAGTGSSAPSEVRAKITPPPSSGLPGTDAASGSSTIIRIDPAGVGRSGGLFSGLLPSTKKGGLSASECTGLPPALMRVIGQGPPAMPARGTETTPSPAPSAT